MEKTVHLLKLSVGSDSVEQIADWQARRSRQRRDGRYYHLTRMWPRREAEILAGGSIFWVVKGLVQCRQRVTALERMTGQDGIDRCAIFLDPELIRTATTPRRPFQGWRYLETADAPPDLPAHRQSEDALPPELAGALADIGVL